MVAVATIGLLGTVSDARRFARHAANRSVARSPLLACLVAPSATSNAPSVDQHPSPPVRQELFACGGGATRNACGLGLALQRRQSSRFGCNSLEHAPPVDDSRWQQLAALRRSPRSRLRPHSQRSGVCLSPPVALVWRVARTRTRSEQGRQCRESFNRQRSEFCSSVSVLSDSLLEAVARRIPRTTSVSLFREPDALHVALGCLTAGRCGAAPAHAS